MLIEMRVVAGVLVVAALGCKDKVEQRPNDPAPAPKPPPDYVRPTASPTLDLDRNGEVTNAERFEARKRRLGITLLQLDADKDGKVSLAELEGSQMPYL